MAKAVQLSLALAALFVASAAAAQDAPPSDQSTIVITGEKNTKKAIRDFVRDLTPVASSVQLSRFERSVCPVAIGLPPAQAQAIANRMRRVARSVGIAVGGSKCAPNVIVIVTADKQALLAQLLRQRPEYFGDLSRRQVAALQRGAGPAAAWQLAGPDVNADGAEINWDPILQVPVNRTITPGSRITDPSRPQYGAAVVVVERAALAGLTTTQLADYAAMRAYTGADPARIRNPRAPTILGILEAPMGSAVPVTLTQWDFGFLRGLYTNRRDLKTAATRAMIGDTIRETQETPPDK